MNWLARLWCDWFHGGGDIKRDECGRINWQCRKCGRWCDPVPLCEEAKTTDAAIAILALTIAGAASYTSSNNTRHASACKRTPAGFLLPMKFTKPTISIDDQIALLRSRGLVIADEDRAKHYLRFVGYYRLAGYALPYQLNYNADGSHRFLDSVSFEDILDLYVFDRKLRLAVMDAVERIEVAFRAQFSQTMSELHDPHWFMDAAHFVPSYRHDKFIERVKDDIGHDKSRAAMRQTFIKHYYDKYGEVEEKQ